MEAVCVACGTVCHSITEGGLKPEGSGPLLIVLEGPDSAQDFSGSYFAGPSGRVLSDLLERAGIPRESTTVCAARLCRGDSDQARDGAARYVAESDAHTIIGLGDGAMRLLLRRGGLQAARGKAHPLHAFFGRAADVWPSYGLDLVRRVPNFRGVVVSDLQRAVGSTRRAEAPAWRYWTPGDDFVGAFDYIAWDIETAIDGKIVDYPTMMSASTGSEHVVAIDPIAIRDLADALVQYAEDDTILVTHNGHAFDVPVMRRWGVDMPWGRDTLVMSYCVDETVSRGLESLTMQHLGAGGWKHGDWKTFDPTSQEAAEYAARDAKYTHALYHKLLELLGDRVPVVEDILVPAHRALSAVSARGIYVDPEAVAGARIEQTVQMERAEQEVIEIAVWHQDPISFNPNSSRDVGRYLIKQGHVLPETPTGKPKTSDDVLNGIDDPLVEPLLRYRSARKLLGTYVGPYEKIITEGDGRVHPEFSVVRTLTGRSAAKSLNVQNLPRELKGFFGAPSGSVLVEVDYSAAEFRIAGYVAQEPTIVAKFTEDVNWDPHRYFASLFFDKPEAEITKPQRQIAKSANFGLLFCGTAQTLVSYAAGMGIDLELSTAAHIRSAWHGVFPGFTSFYADTRREMEQTSEVRTLTGHVRHFGDVSIMPPHIKAESLRQAVNCKVQGPAAHIAFIALAELDRLGLPVVNFVHDAFYFEFTSLAEWEEHRATIERTMCLYPFEFLRDRLIADTFIPLTVEAKVTEYA